MGQAFINKYYNSGSLNFIPNTYFTVGEYHPDAIRALRPDIWRNPEVRRLGNELLDLLKSWIIQDEVPVYKRRLDDDLTNMNSSILADQQLTKLRNQLRDLTAQIENSKEYRKAQATLISEKGKANKQFNLDYLKTKYRELLNKLNNSKEVLEARKNVDVATKTIKKTSKIDEKEKELENQKAILLNRYQIKAKLSDLLAEVDKAYRFGKYDPKVINPKVLDDIKNPNNKEAFQKLKIGMVDFANIERLNEAYDDFYLAKSKYDNSLLIDMYILILEKELFNLKVSELASDIGVVHTQKKLDEAIESKERELGIAKYLSQIKDTEKKIANLAPLKKATENLDVVRKGLEKDFKVDSLKAEMDRIENEIRSQYFIAQRKEDIERNAGTDIWKAQLSFDNAVKKALSEPEI